MKKIICMLLALVLLLGTVAFAESADLTGKWALSLISDGVYEYNPADLGIEMVMVLNADGTVMVTTSGEDDMTGTWAATADGADITVEGETSSLTFDRDFLVGDDGDTILLFEKVTPAGMWYLNNIVMEETEFTPDTLGMDMAIELLKDGTAVVSMTGEDDSVGTWLETEAGIDIVVDGDTLSFKLDDGVLSADEDGVTLVFTRTALIKFSAGEPIVAASLEDFNGTWNCVKVDFMGMLFNADLMEVTSTLTISNGDVTENDGYEVNTSKGTLIDGVLVVEAGYMEGVVVTLYDSGILGLETTITDDFIMTYYYELAE